MKSPRGSFKKMLFVLIACHLVGGVGAYDEASVIFELGDYVLVINDNWERRGDDWPLVAGLSPIGSRESYEHNVYTLQITNAQKVGPKDYNYLPLPATEICIYDTVYSGMDISKSFYYELVPVGEIQIGRINPINTTLFTGEFSVGDDKKTPYFVKFPVDNRTTCWIYDSNTKEYMFKRFLNTVDILAKDDLCLWSTLI